MSSQSEYIPLTIRLKNELYQEFHRLVTERGHTHVAVVRILIRQWLDEHRPKREKRQP
jgi:hypothetical protein